MSWSLAISQSKQEEAAASSCLYVAANMTVCLFACPHLSPSMATSGCLNHGILLSNGMTKSDLHKQFKHLLLSLCQSVSACLSRSTKINISYTCIIHSA